MPAPRELAYLSVCGKGFASSQVTIQGLDASEPTSTPYLLPPPKPFNPLRNRFVTSFSPAKQHIKVQMFRMAKYPFPNIAKLQHSADPIMQPRSLIQPPKSIVICGMEDHPCVRYAICYHVMGRRANSASRWTLHEWIYFSEGPTSMVLHDNPELMQYIANGY